MSVAIEDLKGVRRHLTEYLPVSIYAFCTRERGNWTIVEPQAVLEDFLWPFALVAASATNRTEVGILPNEQYETLINSGEMAFVHTDIVP